MQIQCQHKRHSVGINVVVADECFKPRDHVVQYIRSPSAFVAIGSADDGVDINSAKRRGCGCEVAVLDRMFQDSNGSEKWIVVAGLPTGSPRAATIFEALQSAVSGHCVAFRRIP